MLNIPKVAQYARFSSDNQRSESIDAQIRAMNQFCKQNHWQVVSTYTDEARSATTDNRPQFQQMIADSGKGLFDIVLVHKLDRFSRDRYDSAIYKKKLKKNHVKLCSVLERMDDSPESIMMEAVLEGMSEYYSKNLAREVMKGMNETALQCKHTGGCPPLGYDLDENRHLIINEQEAQAVRIIFQMFADGHGYTTIIDYLNAHGYKTKREKMNAVVEDIIESHAKGQPVLVGTITIEMSEELSAMLKKRGIKHNVLNAKFHEKEAEIISHAGEIGAVTIATNMAGRGTDIVLEDGVAELGGLKIIGTERHESRRIDNQLRGRAGRQGDPGESKFYLSLEDDLMRLFGSERMISIYNALGIPEGEEIQHKTISKTIEKAQKKIENNNFGIRKNLLDYDRVNNEQREVMYKERRRVLDGDDMKESVLGMMKETVANHVYQVISDELPPEEWDLAALNAELLPIVPLNKIVLTDAEKSSGKVDDLVARLQEETVALYEQKEKEFEDFDLREIERIILLKVIDRKWMDHIDDMDQLREGIGLQAYGQRDPVVEYRMAGFEMFNDMTKAIQEETTGALFHVQVEQKIEREEAPKITGTNKDAEVEKKPYVRKGAKVGRNDPCPCGSGKKYKNCCGRNK